MELKRTLQEQVAECLDEMTAVLQDLSDEQLAFTDARLDERSIAGVAMHAAGGMPRLCGLATGGAPGSGGRPASGPPPVPSTTAALLAELAEIKRTLQAQIGALSDAQLGAELTMPWGQRSNGTGAVMFAFSHAVRHIGTILDLRALGGFPTHVLG